MLNSKMLMYNMLIFTPRTKAHIPGVNCARERNLKAPLIFVLHEPHSWKVAWRSQNISIYPCNEQNFAQNKLQ